MNNYKIKAFFYFFAVTGFIALFFFNPYLMGDGVRGGLTLCGNTIIPSLFPFMVVSDFIISSGLGSAIGDKLSKITKLIFKLPGCASSVILMSLIGGFPVGAKMTAHLVEENYISEKQGRRMLLFCVNGGPAFAVGAVGVKMLSNEKLGAIIYASLVISSLAIGIMTALLSKDECTEKIKTLTEINGGTVVISIKNATQSMLSICAWVIMFSCIAQYVSLVPLSDDIKAIVNALLEVTSGCNAFSTEFHPMFITAVIGWSGFAVHCQVSEFLQRCKMPYIKFMLGRMANAILSAVVCYLLMKIFRCEYDVFAVSTNVKIIPYSISAPASVAILILGAFLILDNDLAKRKKV